MPDPNPSARQQFLLALAYHEKVAALRADADRALAQKAISAEEYQILREQYAPHERRAQKTLERLRASALRMAEQATQEAAATRTRQAALEAHPGATVADAGRINEEHRRLAASAIQSDANAAAYERLAHADRASSLGEPPNLPLDAFAAQIAEFTEPRTVPSAATAVPDAKVPGALPELADAPAPLGQSTVTPTPEFTADDTARVRGLRRFTPALVLIIILVGIALAGLFLLTFDSPRRARADIAFAPAADGGGAVALTIRNRGRGPLQLHIPWLEERAALIADDEDMAHVGVDVYLRDDASGEFRLLPPFAEAWTAATTSTSKIVEANLEATITFHPDRLNEGGFAGDAIRLVVTNLDGDKLESYTTNLINPQN